MTLVQGIDAIDSIAATTSKRIHCYNFKSYEKFVIYSSLHLISFYNFIKVEERDSLLGRIVIANILSVRKNYETVCYLFFCVALHCFRFDIMCIAKKKLVTISTEKPHFSHAFGVTRYFILEMSFQSEISE